MNIRLISHTAPSKLLDGEQGPLMSLTELVAYCARVSNPGNQANKGTSRKLIEYLIKNKHWSPLEMVNVCLEITTTRDISRQIIRHRSFSFQEFSQRYSSVEDPDRFVYRSARMQDTSNRQSSIDCDDSATKKWFLDKQREVARLSFDLYKESLDRGIAKELARCLLPEGLTATRLYMNGSLRSWIHYIDLRTRPETQKEHRKVATECAKAISEVFPLILDFCNKQ